MDKIIELPDKEYWDALDSYPETFYFSPERVIFHETLHTLQPSTPQANYVMEKHKYETPVIEKTNIFMFDKFGEPYRSTDHSKVIFPTR